MTIMEAGEARLLVELNKRTIAEENLDLVLGKEEVWHSIKQACILGQYKTIVKVKNDTIAKFMKAIYKGYGYDVEICNDKVFVGWE